MRKIFILVIIFSSLALSQNIKQSQVKDLDDTLAVKVDKKDSTLYFTKFQGDTLKADVNANADSINSHNDRINEAIGAISDYASFNNARNNYIYPNNTFGAYLNTTGFCNVGDSLVKVWAQADDNIYYKSSLDGGRTYSATRILYTRVDAVNNMDVGISFSVIDSKWYIGFNVSAGNDVAAQYIITSTNAGQTWSSEISIPMTNDAYFTSRFVETSTGKIMVAFSDQYYYTQGSDSNYIKIAFSTDAGATWHVSVAAQWDRDETTLVNPNLTETAIAIDNNDSLLMVCRSEPYYGSYLLKSKDLGVTWTKVGMIGQTMSPIGVNLYSPTPDIYTTNDSVFVVIASQRTDGGNSKKGYLSLWKTTYYESCYRNDATYGFKTLLPPVFVEAESWRGVLTNEGNIALVNGSVPIVSMLLTPTDLALAKNYLFEANKYATGQYSVIGGQNYYVSSYEVSSATATTIFRSSYSLRGSNPRGVNLVGTIPVVKINAECTAISAGDTLEITLTDLSGNQMTGMSLKITNSSYGATEWLPLIPTNSQISTTEAGFLVKARRSTATTKTIVYVNVYRGWVAL